MWLPTAGRSVQSAENNFLVLIICCVTAATPTRAPPRLFPWRMPQLWSVGAVGAGCTLEGSTNVLAVITLASHADAGGVTLPRNTRAGEHVTCAVPIFMTHCLIGLIDPSVCVETRTIPANSYACFVRHLLIQDCPGNITGPVAPDGATGWAGAAL